MFYMKMLALKCMLVKSPALRVHPNFGANGSGVEWAGKVREECADWLNWVVGGSETLLGGDSAG